MGYSLSAQLSQAPPHCQADQGHPVRRGNGTEAQVSPIRLKLHLHIQYFSCRTHFSILFPYCIFVNATFP